MSISQLEIKDTLFADPAVAEACVFGISHPDLGEEVAATVVIRPGWLVTERKIRERVASRLSPQKVPRVIAFVTAIPNTPTNKPMRSELSATVAGLLTQSASSGFSLCAEQHDGRAVVRSEAFAL